MIPHPIITVTFMTNSVSESCHVGHSVLHFKSIYFYAINSLIVQIHAYMQIFQILIIQIDIYVCFTNREQAENK